jgi:hypothetical protein
MADSAENAAAPDKVDYIRLMKGLRRHPLTLWRFCGCHGRAASGVSGYRGIEVRAPDQIESFRLAGQAGDRFSGLRRDLHLSG